MGLYDAVPVPPKWDKASVLRLLRERFPEFAHLFGDPNNIDPEAAEPYYSYGRLVQQALEKQRDKALLRRISSFIDELILSEDDLLEEMAIVEVLEGLAQDAALALELYPTIGPDAQDALRQVERKIYGRFRD